MEHDLAALMRSISEKLNKLEEMKQEMSVMKQELKGDIEAGVKGIDLEAWNDSRKRWEGEHQEVIAFLEAAIAAKKVLDDAGLAILDGDMAGLRPLVKKWSGNEDVLNLLNWADDGGYFPLFEASFQGHADLVQLLVDTPSIDANKVDGNGWTAMMTAAYCGHPNVVRVLLAVPGIDLTKRATGGYWTKGKTALGIAMTRDDDEGDEEWARKQECEALVRAAGAHE